MYRKLFVAALILLQSVTCTFPADAYVTLENSDAPFTWPASEQYYQNLEQENTYEEPEQTTDPAPQSLSYQVQSGDTLYKIASSFGLKLDTIIAANGISNPKLLQVGQALQIPASDSIALPADLTGTVTQVMTATLTAYTAGYESTGKKSSDAAYGITYSGAKVQDGHTVAVDPAVIPIGSTLFIEGVGIRKAEDTGSAIRGKKIDVYISSLDEARKFGVKKNVNVYVLKSDSV